MKRLRLAFSEAWTGGAQAKAERDRVVVERDAALAAVEAMRIERDLAYEERDQAFADRDKAQRQFDITTNTPIRGALSEPRLRNCYYQNGKGSGTRALMVPLRGSVSNREIQVTQPFFEAYCRQAGIDLLIIDVPPSLPAASVYASLCALAEDYERFGIIEPHMVIREGCPDLFALVPRDEVGAVIEGRCVDRQAQCAELSGLCGFLTPMPGDHYLNTDLLVLGRAHLPVLRALAKEPMTDYRLTSQDALNALLYHKNIAVCALTRDFNWIPYAQCDFDWRWAWIFNMADSWRSPPTQKYAWQSQAEDGNGRYSRRRLAPEDCRLPSLIEIAEQLRGNIVRFVTPAEMSYRTMSARIHLREEAALMWCSATSGDKQPSIYGPYIDLSEGRWSVTLLEPDGVSPAHPAIVVDLVHDVGRNTVRPASPVGPGASFDIILDRDITQVEVRIYPGEQNYSIGCIAFRLRPD